MAASRLTFIDASGPVTKIKNMEISKTDKPIFHQAFFGGQIAQYIILCWEYLKCLSINHFFIVF